MTSPPSNPASDPSLDDDTAERFVRLILEANLEPDALAAELGVSLSKLALWTLQPQTSAILDGLSRLANARAQMIVGRYRSSAAVHLLKIVTSDEPSELVRKACVDFLAMDLSAHRRTDRGDGRQARSAAPGRSGWSEPIDGLPPPASEAAILQALERMGQAEDPHVESNNESPSSRT